MNERGGKWTFAMAIVDKWRSDSSTDRQESRARNDRARQQRQRQAGV